MATIKILLRNKKTVEGLYPIVLRITKNRIIKLISLGMNCEQKDWDSSNQLLKKSHANYIQRNRVILNIKTKALKIIDDFNLIDFQFLKALDISIRYGCIDLILLKEEIAEIDKETLLDFANFIDEEKIIKKTSSKRNHIDYGTYWYKWRDTKRKT